MRALKSVRVRFLGKEASCTALIDTGSGATVVQRRFFEESFGAAWSALEKPVKLCWIGGEFIQADKYAQLITVVDEFHLPETVFVVDESAEEVEVEGGRVRLPELVVGSGTMGKYGITLDPKEGVKLTRAAPLL